MFETTEAIKEKQPPAGLLSWQQELQNNITNIDQLKRYLELSSDEEGDLRKVIGSTR